MNFSLLQNEQLGDTSTTRFSKWLLNWNHRSGYVSCWTAPILIKAMRTAHNDLKTYLWDASVVGDFKLFQKTALKLKFFSYLNFDTKQTQISWEFNELNNYHVLLKKCFLQHSTFSQLAKPVPCLHQLMSCCHCQIHFWFCNTWGIFWHALLWSLDLQSLAVVVVVVAVWVHDERHSRYVVIRSQQLLNWSLQH